jgi:predicted chitinase
MAKLLDWIFGRHYDSSTPRTMPSVSPTPDTQPITPATASKTDGLPPLKNWCHPFKDTRDPLQQLTHLANATAGYYPLGRNGLWHGGVHFDSGTAAGLKQQSSVHCLADGEVVAYRLDRESPKTTYYDHKITVAKPFSRNFALVRHRLQPPKIQGCTDKPPSLVFYSLYMHLQDWVNYDDDPTLARPGFWPEVHRVKVTANDPHPDDPEQRGLHVYYRPRSGKVADFLPRGAEVVISGQGDYRRLKNRLGPASLSNDDGSLRGYLASRYLQSQVAGEHRIETRGDELNVRPEASLRNEAISTLPDGTIVTVSGEGDFRKLERVPQYVQFAALQSVLEPLATDQIVVLDIPVAIPAGALIGHLGDYHSEGAERPKKKLHLETFSEEDVEVFIVASRAWAQRLPARERTWLKLAKGTAVMAHRDGASATRWPVPSKTDPVSDADLLIPKSLLEGLPAEDKFSVPATPDRKALNWYRLDGLLHDAAGNLLNGWVREDVGDTPWVSPWDWEGYEVLHDYGRPIHAMASFMRSMRHFSEAQLDRYRSLADDEDQGPIRSSLFDIIDPNRVGQITADELQAALRLPAQAQAIAQMIIRKESEWFHRAHVWDVLDEMLGHSGSTPHLNWLAEKQRIKELSWWEEVADKVGLPSWGKAYHFHPIGLVGGFSCKGFTFTLASMKKIYPKLGADRYDDLQSIAEELNNNFLFYRLDTPLRRTHFFAQILQETGGNLMVEEGFSYEAGALIRLFSYFRNNPEKAEEHGYKFRAGNIKANGMPMGRLDYEAIANGAYGARNELGNGSFASGDGWKYRGRGLKQLTGRNNYKKLQEWHMQHAINWPGDNPDFLAEPELLIMMKYAVRSAASFWLNNKLYEIADKGSDREVVDLITKVVNRYTESYDLRGDNFARLWKEGALH